MSKRTLAHERVFPERNRGVLESTPALEAYRHRSTWITATYGHVVSQLHEILADVIEEHPTLSNAIRNLWPQEEYSNDVHGEDMDRLYSTLYDFTREMVFKILAAPYRQRNNELKACVAQCLDTLCATNEQQDAVTVQELHDWLQESRLFSNEEQFNAFMDEYGYWVTYGRDGSSWIDNRDKQILLDEIQDTLAEAYACFLLEDVRQEQGRDQEEIWEQIEAIIKVNAVVRQSIENKCQLIGG